MAPVWRHQCLPSPALATAVAVRFYSSIVFDDIWNLSVCGEYLKSSARTLLLDPATYIAVLTCILLLYLAWYLLSVLVVLLTSAFVLPGFPSTI